MQRMYDTHRHLSGLGSYFRLTLSCTLQYLGKFEIYFRP